MASIKDVAKKAGVAISTVSYALNDHPKISKETIKRIKKIAEELDYVPNVHAKKLKNKKTNRIGVFLHSISGAYFNDLLPGVEKELDKNKYELLVSTFHDERKMNSYNLMAEKWVDGAVIHNASLWDDEMLLKLARKLPIVLIDREPFNGVDNICTIVLDNFRGTYDVTEHLISQGYTSIGFMAGKQKTYDNTIRFEAYKKALEDNGLPLDNSFLLDGGFDEKLAYYAMADMLKTDRYPQALVCANDQMAIGAIQASQEKGLSIPKDIAVTGFDDIRLSSILFPTLTTVSYNRHKMGTLAIKLIIDMLEKRQTPSAVTFETEVIIRDSSKKV